MGTFEHPKHMLRMIGKIKLTILPSKLCLSKPMILEAFKLNGHLSFHNLKINHKLIIFYLVQYFEFDFPQLQNLEFSNNKKKKLDYMHNHAKSKSSCNS